MKLNNLKVFLICTVDNIQDNTIQSLHNSFYSKELYITGLKEYKNPTIKVTKLSEVS